jgi:hypothetical protein
MVKKDLELRIRSANHEGMVRAEVHAYLAERTSLCIESNQPTLLGVFLFAHNFSLLFK